MKPILMALSASTVLLGTMLVPSARASVAVAPGHGPLPVAQHIPYKSIPYKSIPYRNVGIRVVSLGASFSPSALTLAPGEPLVILVSHSVRARLEMTPGQSLVYDGQQGNVYVFTGRRAGMATVAAAVRPRCQTHTCPQWRTAPELVVTTF